MNEGFTERYSQTERSTHPSEPEMRTEHCVVYEIYARHVSFGAALATLLAGFYGPSEYVWLPIVLIAVFCDPRHYFRGPTRKDG